MEIINMKFYKTIFSHMILRVGTCVQGHVSPLILCLIFTFWLLVLEKQYGGIHPITINEVTYCLIAHNLWRVWNGGSWCSNDIKFVSKLGGVTCGYLQHPQFSVIISHFSGITIFTQYLDKLFPFVWRFYACPSPLYFP